MLIMSGDLFNLMKLEIGDTIEITDNFDGLFLPGTRFKVINTQYVELAKSGKTYKFKYLIDEKFKKVKEYKRVVLASAVNRLSDSEKIFIKINDQYHTIDYIQVMKDQVDVGYDDIQDRSLGVSHSGNESINNIAFYKEV